MIERQPSSFVREIELEGGSTLVTYDEQAPIIGLQVARFNWRLRRARESKDWSRAELARQSGVDPTTVGRAERLFPINEQSRWKLALALGVPEDVLFPGEIDALPTDGPETIELSITRDEMVAVTERDEHAALIEGAEHAALATETDAVLDTLPPRMRRVLRLRFGLDDGSPRSLAEVGQQFGTTRERIRQIEAMALRRLRHPVRSKRLREYFDHRTSGTSAAPEDRCVLHDGARARCDESFELPSWMLAAPLDELKQPMFWCDPCWAIFVRFRQTEASPTPSLLHDFITEQARPASRDGPRGRRPEPVAPSGRADHCTVWRGPLRRCEERFTLPDEMFTAPLEVLEQPSEWCVPCWALFLRWRMTHRVEA